MHTPYFKRPTMFTGTIAGTFHQMISELPRNTNFKVRGGESPMVASCKCGADFGLKYTAPEREAAYVAHIEASKS